MNDEELKKAQQELDRARSSWMDFTHGVADMHYVTTRIYVPGTALPASSEYVHSVYTGGSPNYEPEHCQHCGNVWQESKFHPGRCGSCGAPK